MVLGHAAIFINAINAELAPRRIAALCLYHPVGIVKSALRGKTL
jgi:hypothetical protein